MARDWTYVIRSGGTNTYVDPKSFVENVTVRANSTADAWAAIVKQLPPNTTSVSLVSIQYL